MWSLFSFSIFCSRLHARAGKRQKKSTAPQFLLVANFVLSRFWEFLGEGSAKTPPKKDQKMYFTLVLFWFLTYPPTKGFSDFVLAGPSPWPHDLVLGVALLSWPAITPLRGPVPRFRSSGGGRVAKAFLNASPAP
jgi:hypothetical protein